MYNERHVTEPAMCDVPCEMLYETKPRCYKDQTSHLQPGNISPDDAAAERPDLQEEVWETSRFVRYRGSYFDFQQAHTSSTPIPMKSLARQLPIYLSYSAS